MVAKSKITPGMKVKFSGTPTMYLNHGDVYVTLNVIGRSWALKDKYGKLAGVVGAQKLTVVAEQ